MPWFLTLHSMSLVSSVDGIKRSSGSRCSKRHAARSQASDRFLQRTQGDATPPETQSECQDFSRSATTQQSMKQVLVLCSLLSWFWGRLRHRIPKQYSFTVPAREISQLTTSTAYQGGNMRYSFRDLECLESIIRIIKYLQFCKPSLPRCPNEEPNWLSWQWCILENSHPNARMPLSNCLQYLKKMDLIFQLSIRPQLLKSQMHNMWLGPKEPIDELLEEVLEM